MRKLTKAEAGALGAAKGKITQQQQKAERIDKYMQTPTRCIHCDSPMGYDKRHNKFCSSTCAASHNNSLRETKKITWNCIHCNTEHTSDKSKVGKFCNLDCQRQYQYTQRIIEWKETGSIGKGTVKKYLAEQRRGCWKCGITSWNDNPIVLELEHIDGNSDNNIEENLSLLCPNCHSQTDTYKGKNVGNGRYNRRQRYAQGKSF